MSIEVILLIVVALMVGLLLGWLLGGRTAATVRSELAGVQVRADQAELLRKTLDEVEREREDATSTIAALRADHNARAESFEAQLKQLTEAKDALGAQFAETAAKLLDTAQRQFLDRAEARFKQSEDATGQGLKAALSPIAEKLEKYEASVKQTEAERQNAFGVLAGQIEAMRLGTERVSGEAAKLVNALRNAPKARGRWGEQQLKNVFETCGLSEHIDFNLETSTSDDEGKRLRPDAIVRLPGSKALVIDAKVSLNDYQDAFDAADEATRTLKLKAHLTSMRGHILALADKGYWDQFDDAPDYVIMFVPGEHFMTAALDLDSDLWNYAYSRRVILATPANLIAIARTVATVWRQETLVKESRRIGDLGKELYDRLAKVSEDLGRAGSSLNTAVKQFNTATNSFNTRLTVTGKKLRDINIDTGNRELEDISPVETLASHIVESDKVVALNPPAA